MHVYMYMYIYICICIYKGLLCELREAYRDYVWGLYSRVCLGYTGIGEPCGDSMGGIYGGSILALWQVFGDEGVI